ncbi:MAG TPA: hypothetical protein VLH39_05205 [Magnetospirillaceae bacterium]|nr:hypothetical protein [Magnetospirillaceae bacterium]
MHRILHQVFGDPQVVPPAHYIPVADKYFEAIRTGLGYGLVARVLAADGLENGSLTELRGSIRAELVLYWHCWKYQSEQLRELSETVILEGSRLLGP